jgi:hypothetical protein
MIAGCALAGGIGYVGCPVGAPRHAYADREPADLPQPQRGIWAGDHRDDRLSDLWIVPHHPSIASASLVTLLDRREDVHLDTLGALVNLTNIPIRNVIENAHGLTHSVAAAISALIGQQAAALAFADIFLITGALTLVSVPLILGIPKPTNTDVTIEVG